VSVTQARPILSVTTIRLQSGAFIRPSYMPTYTGAHNILKMLANVTLQHFTNCHVIIPITGCCINTRFATLDTGRVRKFKSFVYTGY